MNKISRKWSRIAKNWLNNEDGKHCHWCKHIVHDDGCSYCKKERCKYNDGYRIRSWDGFIAEDCKFFELEDWYTDDKNFDEYFKGDKK